MVTREVKITNGIGLHARPATFFVQKANEYDANIKVEIGDRVQSAKSLLGVLSLGITKDTVITLVAEGKEEKEAMEGLVELLNTGLPG